MTGDLIHPAMVSALYKFYPSSCTIQQRTDTRDAAGQPIPSWSDVEEHIDLACRIAPNGGREVKQTNKSYAVSSHTIALQGQYTTITTKHRVVAASQAYDILAVEHDGQGETTRLTVEVVV